MKKVLTACAIAAATLAAAPAFAQGYIGLGAGSSSVRGVDGNQGIAPNSVTGGNSNKGSFKLYGGYQFTPNWGVEAQYSDLGNRNFSILNGAGALVAPGSYKTSQFSIAGTGTLPLNSSFALFGKLGVTSNTVKISAAGIADRGTKTSLLAGLGVSYNITPALSVRLEYEDFGKLTKDDGFGGAVRGNAYSLSLKYAF